MFLVLFGTFPIYPGDCHVASLLAMTAVFERFKQQFIFPEDSEPCHWFSISSALFSVVSVIFSPPMIRASSRLRPSKSRGVTVV